MSIIQRVQTVSKKTNKLFYDLIKSFKNKTSCPILVNTSLCKREPIVNTPEDAFNCFMGTNLDVLVIGNFYLDKEKQDKKLKKIILINSNLINEKIQKFFIIIFFCFFSI